MVVQLQRAVPILTVADVPAAAGDYAAALGPDVIMNRGWIATLGSVDGTGFSVMTRDITAPCHPDMSIQVPDLDETHQPGRPWCFHSARLRSRRGPASATRYSRRRTAGNRPLCRRRRRGGRTPA